MELVLCWSRWCAKVSTPHGCSHEGIPWVLCSYSGTCAESDCNHRAAPVKLVTGLCIKLTHSLNPDVYKYVRNTNSSVLQECKLSLLCVPRQKMCFVPVLGYTWSSSRGEVAAQPKFLGSNHRYWKEQIPLICRSSTERAESQPCTVSAGIAGHRPLWIKLWVINPAGSQIDLPFSKPASSMPSALHRGVPTERGWVEFY